MNVNYKKGQKHYKTAKYPIRQPIYLTWLIQVLSLIVLAPKKHKVEKINMEGLKPPYILLSNHMSFVDFEMVSLGTYPHRVNNVVNIDGFYLRDWLLEWIGAICTRKFTADMHLIKSIEKVLERGDILCMYPEARYSPAGTTSYLPESLGMLIRRSKVPVVVALHRGNYLHAPFWSFRKKRRVPLHTTMTQILTKGEAETLSVSEINERLRSAFVYDDYKYQQENGIRITEKFRAEGMHKILYQCPHCKTEFRMASKGRTLTCTSCGKSWELTEEGYLTALSGETEFSHVPDWFEWEREQVRREVLEGRYSYSDDEVDVYSLPHAWKFHPLGKASLTHDPENGFVLKGLYRGQEYEIKRSPLQMNSLHVEYDFPHVKPYDCIDISTSDDSFYCYPSKENVVTKLAFATEEIYQLELKRVREKRRTSRV